VKKHNNRKKLAAKYANTQGLEALKQLEQQIKKKIEQLFTKL